MLMVVTGHILCLSINHSNSPLFLFFNIELEVPLFFFVSGLVCPPILDCGWSEAFARIFRKVVALVVPAILFLALYDQLSGRSFVEGLTVSYKHGYWFTITLAEFISMHTIASMLLRSFGRKTYIMSMLMLCVILIIVSGISMRYEYGSAIIGLFGLTHLKHFVYFFLGTYISSVSLPPVLNRRWKIAAIVAAVILFTAHVACYGLGLASSTIYIFHRLLSFGSVCLFYLLLRYWAPCSASRAGRGLQFIGRRTLDIYFIHYFFLPRHLDAVGVWFETNSNFIVEYIFAIVAAIAVMAVALGVGAIIRLSPILSHILLAVHLPAKGSAKRSYRK